MIETYCHKCRFTFTFTSVEERAAWDKRHPNGHTTDR